MIEITLLIDLSYIREISRIPDFTESAEIPSPATAAEIFNIVRVRSLIDLKYFLVKFAEFADSGNAGNRENSPSGDGGG